MMCNGRPYATAGRPAPRLADSTAGTPTPLTLLGASLPSLYTTALAAPSARKGPAGARDGCSRLGSGGADREAQTCEAVTTPRRPPLTPARNRWLRTPCTRAVRPCRLEPPKVDGWRPRRAAARGPIAATLRAASRLSVTRWVRLLRIRRKLRRIHEQRGRCV